ncbi:MISEXPRESSION SUPPRESSOR OF RAS 6 [Plasmopara halstedii]|uniref:MISEXPRESSION SUPPRESSOR OF RAS 6 n=1 Tax=Plasmopara halstedii TaxID=4781 RepID=A0A0P1AJT5_PLAHL|nr:MISEXPRESSION SUPPRESSOR OF RAS 6 [Plasmopara halstedii]CEG41487.1 MISEXPRESSION SUPPRESSOR OF RAS 6 [Plasmopara halstedii]|eukprot:XP_024577856.1 MISEXPRESSION SUPPRESSOR OF RAS 6 [Plasmopara halstedii]
MPDMTFASPAMVIIAKSTGDEFLPPHQENVVLSSVLRMLKKVIGELSIKVCGASDDLALL